MSTTTSSLKVNVAQTGSSQIRKSIDVLCAGCRKSVVGKEFTTCSMCSGYFDIKCAGITVALYNEMCKNASKPKNKKAAVEWRCTKCAASSQEVVAQKAASVDCSKETQDALLEGFVAKLDGRIEELLNAKFQEIVDGQNAKIAALESKISSLESRIVGIEKSLKDRTEGMRNPSAVDLKSQEAKFERSKNIMIYGVPNDPATAIGDVVKNICSKYDENLNMDNVSCFRLKKSGDSSITSPILCKFSSKIARDKVFFKYIARRDLKLADVMGAAGIDSRIYINEHLSKDEAVIVRKCRELKRNNRIKHFFLRDGNVFVSMTAEKKSAIQINAIGDLDDLLEAGGG